MEEPEREREHVLISMEIHGRNLFAYFSDRTDKGSPSLILSIGKETTNATELLDLLYTTIHWVEEAADLPAGIRERFNAQYRGEGAEYHRLYRAEDLLRPEPPAGEVS